jgi:Type VI secretion, TssG/PASTA domain
MQKYRTMPDLSHSTHAFHHTLDSALESLYAFGVSPSRISLRMTTTGLPEGWIVRQLPLVGETLTDGDVVTLWVSGAGVFRALPAPMWDRGSESEPSTDTLLDLYDDPLEKARHWVRQGSKLFDIVADNLPACARWISLFGLSPDDWPVESWYPLALLLPYLQALAGKERGYRAALDLLVGLPLKRIGRSPARCFLSPHGLSLLSRQQSRLGIDMILGDHKADLARITLFVGPLTLEQYYEFQQPEKQRYLEMVLRLVIPMDQQYELAWSVLDAERAPRLGSAPENSCLGINSYLGTRSPVVQKGPFPSLW